MLLINMLLYLAVSTILIILAMTIGKKDKKNREKASPFECGFSPFNKTRSPFSLRFFIITLLFLIFEVEIALILPIGAANCILFYKEMAIISSIIMFILIAGLVHEWNQGVIKWSL